MNLTVVDLIIVLKTGIEVVRLIENKLDKVKILSDLIVSMNANKIRKNISSELSEAYHNLAELYYIDCENARTNCQEALDTYRKINPNYDNYRFIILDIVFVAETLGDYELAIQKLNELIDISKKSEDNKVLLESIYRRAKLFLKRKSFSEADKDLAELSKIHDIEGRIMRVSLRVEFDYQLHKLIGI